MKGGRDMFNNDDKVEINSEEDLIDFINSASKEELELLKSDLIDAENGIFHDDDDDDSSSGGRQYSIKK